MDNCREYFILEGLKCAGCADKIEEKVKGVKGIKGASLNFFSKKLSIEIADKEDIKRIAGEIASIVRGIEPDVEIKTIDMEAENMKEVIETNINEIVVLGIGILLFTAAFILPFSLWNRVGMFVFSYILIGGRVINRAVRNILKGRFFDENFLMTAATLGAFAVGEYPEAVAVMVFYRIGEFFEELAVKRSRRSIRALMDFRPDYANLKAGDDFIKVHPEDVKIGDIIMIKPGEKVPLDGKVVGGRSTVDTSALTGESMPKELEPGREILSGFINREGILMVEVTKDYSDSTLSRILNLVKDAGNKKAPIENFITRFAGYYTPLVVFSAVGLAVLPPLFIEGAQFGDWLYRALIFLVVSCPCALVLSVPLGFFGGIGAASKKGILVKGGNYLDALNHLDTVVFDKTGTLTKGVFKVTDVLTEGGISRDELLKYAAYAESRSNHPIARSILEAYKGEINNNKIESYEELPGFGIVAKIEGKEIAVGNGRLMKREKIKPGRRGSEIPGTVLHIGINGEYAGQITISDEIKEDAKVAVKQLRDLGVKKIAMLTGDSRAAAEMVGRHLGLDEIYSELLPEQKLEKLEALNKEKSPGGKLAFVGDGINDAPVLARADIGVAMGGLGADAAIEAADIVLMTDEPSGLVSAVKIARITKNVVWQNIVFSLSVKGIILLMGALGHAALWEAVFADVGVALIAVLNAMRVLLTPRSFSVNIGT